MDKGKVSTAEEQVEVDKVIMPGVKFKVSRWQMTGVVDLVMSQGWREEGGSATPGHLVTMAEGGRGTYN